MRTRLGFGIVFVSAVLWASVALGADGRGYEPLGNGARRAYETSSTFAAQMHFAYDVVHQKTSSLPDGAERIEARFHSDAWAAGPGQERIEEWVREPRGLFTPNPLGVVGVATEWGPTPLLPAAPELEQTDCVWHFDGERPLPFALGLLGFLERNPLPEIGRAHV